MFCRLEMWFLDRLCRALIDVHPHLLLSHSHRNQLHVVVYKTFRYECRKLLAYSRGLKTGSSPLPRIVLCTPMTCFYSTHYRSMCYEPYLSIRSEQIRKPRVFSTVRFKTFCMPQGEIFDNVDIVERVRPRKRRERPTYISGKNEWWQDKWKTHDGFSLTDGMYH